MLILVLFRLVLLSSVSGLLRGLCRTIRAFGSVSVGNVKWMSVGVARFSNSVSSISVISRILVMCTSPLLINRRFAGRTKTDIVPCGKCHECLSKQQNEFAALAVLEAKRSKSLYMCALTYDNKNCPIMRTEFNDLGEISSQEFVYGSERYEVFPQMVRERWSNGRLVKYLVEYSPQENVYYEPSLQREKVRLFLKKTRVAFQREFGYLPKFRYAAFGEYGDKFHRPHTHFLFYDFSAQEMSYFADAWSKEFGHMDVRNIPVLNKDGSPAAVKVSKYVSKYLRKPKKDFEPLLRGLCESPRLLTSKGFGVGILPDHLKDFYLCKDLDRRKIGNDAFFSEFMTRKKSLIIDGSKFPLPRKISDSYFRVESYPDIKFNVNENTGEIKKQIVRKTRRSSLQVVASSFARGRYLEDFARKLREDSEKLSNVLDRDRIQKVIADESTALEDRVKTARKYYLDSLKKQKYG